MQLIPVRADVGKISYLLGEELTLKLVFDSRPKDVEQVTNVSVDLLRMEEARNQGAFGFGSAPTWVSGVLELRQKLPTTLQPGLYMFAAATLCWPEASGALRQQRLRFTPVVFAVQTVVETPLTKPDLERLVADLQVARTEHNNRELRTDRALASSNPRTFRVWIFGVGSLIHSHQQLAGYSITPLKQGFSHRRLSEIVHNQLKAIQIAPPPFDQNIEDQFERATPTFVVSYENVRALDQNDALDYCRAHSALLFELLGLDRGQKPSEFFCMAAELGTMQRWHLYQVPGYKGNLVSAFNPASTANLIERLVPKLLKDPFLHLLVKTYSDATAEENSGFALLRYWAVLELLGDHYMPEGTPIHNPDGSPIFGTNGRRKTTKAKEGRVYQYILNAGAYVQSISVNLDGTNKQYMIGADASHPGYTPSTELISLWDMVRAAYAIRNSVAHTGQFDADRPIPGDVNQELAARLVRAGHLDPGSFVQGQASTCMMRELNKT
jgi:hypothetical protein